MMALYFKVDLSNVNVAKVLSTCSERYPLFVVAMATKLTEQLMTVY